MKKRLLAIVFAMLMLCTTLSFSILASINPNGDASNNETPAISWGDAEPEEPKLVGDVDNNGKVNVRDVAKLRQLILEDTEDLAYDIDGNEKVNVRDVAKLRQIILEME